jgi:hypothetical protein
MADALRSTAHRIGGAIGILAILGFGAYTRASGFTTGSLWFDDAWQAMPARESIGTAVRMVTTAPLYTLGLRTWLRLDITSTWWAQLPAFVFGMAGIAAVFFLLAYFKVWAPLAYFGALILAVSPVAADYSTRVKPFGLDLLCGCALLFLFERWRRTPQRRSAVLLGIACALSLFISSTTAVVVISVAATTALCGLRDSSRRLDALVAAGTAAVAGLVVEVLWLRHLSPALYFGWTKRGYLFSASSAHRIAWSLQAMGTGFFHWLVGTPLAHPRLQEQITPGGVALAVLGFLVLLAISLPPLIGLLRRRGRDPGPLVVPAVALCLAIALALAHKSPFGGGRTDEDIYPAVLLLFAGAVSALFGRARDEARRDMIAVLVILTGALLWVGATNRAAYPQTVLRPLAAELQHVGPKSAIIVVDPWLTFTWAYDDLSPTKVSFAHTVTLWSQGFHVVSLDQRVDLSVNSFFPDRSYGELAHRTHWIWYVAATIGRQSPIPGSPNHLLISLNYRYLLENGWQPTGTYLTFPHTEAILMIHVPRRERLGAAR